VLKKVFVPNREEPRREWRKLNNKEFHDFFSSPNVIRVSKWKAMEWAGYEIYIEENKSEYSFAVVILVDRYHI
jgi:hypothetical protein